MNNFERLSNEVQDVNSQLKQMRNILYPSSILKSQRQKEEAIVMAESIYSEITQKLRESFLVMARAFPEHSKLLHDLKVYFTPNLLHLTLALHHAKDKVNNQTEYEKSSDDALHQINLLINRIEALNKVLSVFRNLVESSESVDIFTEELLGPLVSNKNAFISETTYTLENAEDLSRIVELLSRYRKDTANPEAVEISISPEQ